MNTLFYSEIYLFIYTIVCIQCIQSIHCIPSIVDKFSSAFRPVYHGQWSTAVHLDRYANTHTYIRTHTHTYTRLYYITAYVTVNIT